MSPETSRQDDSLTKAAGGPNHTSGATPSRKAHDYYRHEQHLSMKIKLFFDSMKGQNFFLKELHICSSEQTVGAETCKPNEH